MGSTCFAEVQNGDQGLAPDAYRVDLAGPANDLRYPGFCPNCGAEAEAPLTVRKVFWVDSSGDSPATREIVEMRPRFCRTCIDRHHADAIPITPWDTLKTALFSELMIPAVLTLAAGLFFLSITGRMLGSPKAALITAGIAAFFLLISWSSWRSAWLSTGWKRVPAPTKVSRAFDFGPDGSSMFATKPRAYAFHNQAYADAFAAANKDLHARWTGPVQKARERRRVWIGVAIMIAVAALALLFH